jgi:SulP family sulfate permease
MIISAIVVVIFNFESKGVKLIGAIPQALPPFSSFPLTIYSISGMFTSAMAIAILGIVEALSIAKSIASKSGEKIDGNQEFIAQGLANMTAGFTSSIPGSGSFTRSAVNFSSGAKTRFSVVFSGIFVLLVVISFAPFAKFIPISSLAGILMVIAYSMVDQHAFKMAFIATKTDRVVLLTTMIATLFLHLDQAVYLGVFLSIILFVRKVSHPQVNQIVLDEKSHKFRMKTDKDVTCPQISIFQIEGSVFFGAVAEIEEKISNYVKNGGRICIVRMAQVHLVDATGVHAFESLLKEAKARNITMIFANAKPRVMKVFEKTGLIEEVGRENFFEHTSDAITFSVAKLREMGKCKNCTLRIFKECKN